MGSAHRLPQQQSRERSSAEPSCRPLRLQLACSNPSPPYLTREVPCGAACKNRLNRIYVRKIHLAPIRLCRSHWIRAAVRIRHDELAYLFFQWTGIAFDPSQCRASATWLTGKHWAAPYASSLLTGLGHRPGAGLGLLPRLPPPTSPHPVSGVGLGLCVRGFFHRGLPASDILRLFALRSVTVVGKRMLSLHSASLQCKGTPPACSYRQRRNGTLNPDPNQTRRGPCGFI